MGYYERGYDLPFPFHKTDEEVLIRMKNHKMKLIFTVAILLLIFLISLNIYMSYLKIKRTVVEVIGHQSVEAAKSIASSLDIETYQQFLINPTENEEYWKIRNYLNDAREKLGALYVYTLEIDNPTVSKTMIVGIPEDSKERFLIRELCTVPEAQVARAYEGKTYVTDLINDHKHGTYLSVGVPIKDQEGKVIGYLGIDISANQLHDIRGQVMKNSLPILVFSGIFVLIILFTFLLMQKWYQKEAEDTEDTYQTEIRTLLSSVQSLRHDFINHIQVLHGLLKLGNGDQALEYASSLFKEAQLISSLKVNVDNPGLSVLLQTKKLSAQNHNIDIQFTISNDPFETIKTTDLIKILSNLIDNAIDATTELPEDQRKINIVCKADVTHYVFKITNTGPRIIDKEHIFKSGFSTKKEVPGKVRGQGLFIVREVVNKYNGNISFDSTELETTAIVEISK